MAEQQEYILWSTLGCHLCELAEEILAQVQVERQALRWQVRDIADDLTLIERYGVRIPVLYCANCHAELGWPFGTAELSAWLSRCDALHCS